MFLAVVLGFAFVKAARALQLYWLNLPVYFLIS